MQPPERVDHVERARRWVDHPGSRDPVPVELSALARELTELVLPAHDSLGRERDHLSGRGGDEVRAVGGEHLVRDSPLSGSTKARVSAAGSVAASPTLAGLLPQPSRPATTAQWRRAQRRTRRERRRAPRGAGHPRIPTSASGRPALAGAVEGGDTAPGRAGCLPGHARRERQEVLRGQPHGG